MKLITIMAPVLLVTVMADQFSKYCAVSHLAANSMVVIPDFFSLTLAFNRGAAFGFMGTLPDGTRQFALGAATLCALAAIMFMLFRYHRDSTLGCAAVGLVLGGALGNIIDRVQMGVVVDFLDVYWKDYHWPTFNVADSCICVGVAVLILLKTDKPAVAEAAQVTPS